MTDIGERYEALQREWAAYFRTLSPGWYAWRVTVCVAPLMLLAIADLEGFLPIDSFRLAPTMVLVGVVLMLGVDAFRRRSPWTRLYLVFFISIALGIVQSESRMERLEAQWRIARNVACLDNSESAAAVCDASYDPCNVAGNLRRCWSDLYRDAGWSEPDMRILEEGARQQRLAAHRQPAP